MSSSEVDSVPPPAVKSLRSKFEQLALLETSPKPSHTHDFLLPQQTSPRPRALSDPDEQQTPPSQHIRNSSSSSDLRGKKPPPPPPPRSKKPYVASPFSSPLLRPVHPASPSGSSEILTSGRSSIKELTARPPPPIPSLFLDDQTQIKIHPVDGNDVSNTGRELPIDQDVEVPHTNDDVIRRAAPIPARPNSQSFLDGAADEESGNSVGVSSLVNKFALVHRCLHVTPRLIGP
ncbi:hypothetical protein FA95DRAFT_1253206 [Auriscalpium vulgare]|uniref:Uncharacterized protein n=1 Tax=Auriscalpium vulgare TaxID=40419 RepID=A0ACB8S9W6_9AGAM|nr:hypothetical protein FA95DRAFT_1253206 [Auriscalpium vulgare]